MLPVLVFVRIRDEASEHFVVNHAPTAIPDWIFAAAVSQRRQTERGGRPRGSLIGAVFSRKRAQRRCRIVEPGILRIRDVRAFVSGV